jgi:PAS domain S-box-containing protein
VSIETKAVLFNAVPLLILAALYLAASAALAPAFWRERRRLSDLAYVSALLFPCIGLASVLVGLQLAVDREPLGGHLWLSLPVMVVVAVPILALFANWEDRELLVTGIRRARAAEEMTSLRDRELQAVERLSRELVRADDPREIGRLVADEAIDLFGVDFAELVLVEEGGRTVRIVAAREQGRDVDWLLGLQLDLERERTGIATVLAQPAPVAVADAQSSPVVSKRLSEGLGARSAAYVPVFADERTVGVLVVVTRQPRAFGGEELSLMQAFASEAGMALSRAASAVALAEALERERLVARISLEVRSRVALDELLTVACEESARAIGCSRCFIRLAEPGQRAQMLAQWVAEGVDPLTDKAQLPVANLAAREARTIAIGDVTDAPELRDATLGDADELIRLGTQAVLATPLFGFGAVIGTLSFHRPEPTVWTPSEVLLAEAVARESASAIHTGRILRESERRLAEQTALLSAGQALTSELRFDAVISRIVKEMRTLIEADAVDCWTLRPGGRELECRAVLGLPESEVGRRIPVAGTLAEQAEAGVPVLRRGLGESSVERMLEGDIRFAEAIEAPLVAFGEVVGLLAVYAVEADTFGDDDLRLVAAFASLASIALRNAEAFERSTRQAQVERGFYRVASVLSDPLSAEATLDAVARAACEALAGDAAAVLRAVGRTLELAGAHELPEELAAFLLSDGAGLAAAAAGGKLLASPSLAQETRFGSELPAVASEAGLEALLAIPLPEPRTDANGLVLVFFSTQHHPTEEQLELAGHVAGTARGALERSELFELERRSRALAQRLTEAGRELASELDPESVLERVVVHAAALLDAAASAVWVLESDELVVHAAAGEGVAHAIETRVPSTAWLLGDIVQSRRPTAIADVAADERAAETDPILAAGYASYLGVPAVGPDGAVQGVLAVYDRSPRDWQEEEGEALLALASSSAASRANAEQYQDVRHEQQRSDAILANVADGIVAVDRDGKVVLWNPAAEEITGVPAKEAVGRTPAQVLGRSLASDGGLPAVSRLVPIRRGGEEAWLSVSEAVMTDPAGATAGRIYAFRDISAERAVEQMKSDFVSTVSHELRTPLTSIFGFAETLLRQDVLFGEPERETFLRYISSESERLTAIVDRLLSVAQLDTGAMTVQLAETEVGRVVADVIDTAEEKLGGDGHDFVLALEDGPLAAHADPEKLKQVLTHLLDNAVRYSPAGGRVTVGARRAARAVEVRVEDEGVGIPRAEHERIFRKFYRGESTARTAGAGATGLGLFLAQGLVQAMGGRIWVDSDEGRGATFVVELPAAGE